MIVLYSSVVWIVQMCILKWWSSKSASKMTNRYASKCLVEYWSWIQYHDIIDLHLQKQSNDHWYIYRLKLFYNTVNPANSNNFTNHQNEHNERCTVEINQVQHILATLCIDIKKIRSDANDTITLSTLWLFAFNKGSGYQIIMRSNDYVYTHRCNISQSK